MTFATDSTPNDLQTLKALISTQQVELARVKMRIAKLRRTQFGSNPKQLDTQPRLRLEEWEVGRQKNNNFMCVLTRV